MIFSLALNKYELKFSNEMKLNWGFLWKKKQTQPFKRDIYWNELQMFTNTLLLCEFFVSANNIFQRFDGYKWKQSNEMLFKLWNYKIKSEKRNTLQQRGVLFSTFFFFHFSLPFNRIARHIKVAISNNWCLLMAFFLVIFIRLFRKITIDAISSPRF